MWRYLYIPFSHINTESSLFTSFSGSSATNNISGLHTHFQPGHHAAQQSVSYWALLRTSFLKHHWENTKSVHNRDLQLQGKQRKWLLEMESGEEMANGTHVPGMSHSTGEMILGDEEWVTGSNRQDEEKRWMLLKIKSFISRLSRLFSFSVFD